MLFHCHVPPPQRKRENNHAFQCRPWRISSSGNRTESSTHEDKVKMSVYTWRVSPFLLLHQIPDDEEIWVGDHRTRRKLVSRVDHSSFDLELMNEGPIYCGINHRTRSQKEEKRHSLSICKITMMWVRNDKEEQNKGRQRTMTLSNSSCFWKHPCGHWLHRMTVCWWI